MSREEPRSARLHPRPDILAAFVRGDLSGGVRREVLRHLLAGCGICRRRAAELTAPLFDKAARRSPAEGPEAYELPLRKALSALRGEGAFGGGSTRRPEPPPASRGRRSEPAAGAGTSPVELRENAEAWLERARSLKPGDPRRRLAAGAFAALLAERCAEAVAGSPAAGSERYETAADRAAVAWAETANAHRAIGDRAAAERSFAQALAWIDRGTGDALPLAEIGELVASLEMDAHRFQAAGRLLDRVVASRLALGQGHFAGRALIRRGLVLGCLGDPLAAVERIVAGHGFLEPGRDPQLALAAVHALATCLAGAGLFPLAGAVLAGARPLYAAAAGPTERLKLRWLEARVEIGLGRERRAEQGLREVAAGFAERKLPYQAALAALDLAALQMRQGRVEEVRLSIGDLLVFLRLVGARREAIASLEILERALAAERATARLVARVAARLGRRARGSETLESLFD
ncbi:MAG TPA: hypothetical protein VN783_16185 [Thermoanaerobaculia bacterium]|nr:hypothetical protein [Thermoanaerobaculia bacterium]